MEDRELLELAAKAAGFVLADEVDSYIRSGGLWVVGLGGRDTVWGPLGNDSDALRLMVKLEMQVDQQPHMQRAVAMWNTSAFGGTRFVCEDFCSDRLAATRRAIVRAAAEIGRAKP